LNKKVHNMDSAELAQIATAALRGAGKSSTGLRVQISSATDTVEQLLEVISSLREGADIKAQFLHRTYSFELPTIAYTPTVQTIALWHCDDNDGNSAVDSSENCNTLTLNNTTWTTGKFNHGLQFNGINSYGSASLTSLEPINKYLYAAIWANPNDDGPLITWPDVLKLYIQDGILYANIKDESFMGPAVGSSWQLFHVQFFDGQVLLAVDEIFTLNATTFTDLSISNYDVTIGKDDTSYYNGDIDEIWLVADVVTQEDFHLREFEAHPSTLGYWTFDANYGTTLFHGGLLSLPLTLTNCTWTTGYLGNAVIFDGTTSYASFTPMASSTNKLSIELICKFASVNGTQVLIDQENGINLYYNGLGFVAALNGVSNNNALIAPFIPKLDTWYDIVLTYDGSYKTIWLNGQKIGQVAAAGSANISANTVYVGCNHEHNNFFNGALDFLYVTKHLVRPYYRTINCWLIGAKGFERNADWVLL